MFSRKRVVNELDGRRGKGFGEWCRKEAECNPFRKGGTKGQAHSQSAVLPLLAKLHPGATITPDDNIKRIPIKDLRQEDGAHELATSPDMPPYLQLAKAVMQNADPTAELETIRQLPLDERYVWRMAPA